MLLKQTEKVLCACFREETEAMSTTVTPLALPGSGRTADESVTRLGCQAWEVPAGLTHGLLLRVLVHQLHGASYPEPSDDHGGHLPYFGLCRARFKVSLLVQVHPLVYLTQ